MGGQFLDLLESARGWDGPRPRGAGRLGPPGDPLQEREVHHRAPAAHRCASSAARRPTTSRRCRDYGLALGEAFQLRDDLLGVFGDPEATGKPAGDDLREGKRTVLIAHALDAAPTTRGREIVETSSAATTSTSEGVATLRGVLVAPGAVDAVEDR